jgi:hypothetical protein
MRFIIWQQVLLLICFVAFILAYIAVTYKVTSGPRSTGSALRRLCATTAFGSIIWIVGGSFLWRLAYIGLADSGVPYSLVQGTYYSTFGFPFTIAFHDLLRSVLGSGPQLSYVIGATVPITLLLLGSLVVIVEKRLASGRLSIQSHSRAFGGLLTLVSFIALVIILWPLPMLNTEMPDIPIPDDAIGVHYDHKDDIYMSPTTIFTMEDQSAEQMLLYYKQALQSQGWQLEQGSVYENYPVSGGSAIFSKNGQYLQVSVPGGPYGTTTELILWPSAQAWIDGYR